MSMSATGATPLPMQRVVRTWWPLAASWLVMTFEIPLLAAVVARAADPEIHLAAWGIVFPLALILAAPIMMLLGASTALSKDWASYATLRRYMWIMAASLTLIHALLAFTPLFDWVVRGLIGAPAEVIEPARLGVRIMLPWSAALAYRRFNYGVLIRFGDTRTVTVGAILRLTGDVVALAALFALMAMGVPIPGIALAAVAIACGVLTEAFYAHFRVRPLREQKLRPAPAVPVPLTLRTFLAFYLPLVMTSLLQIMVQPIGSAALSRMPDPLHSLAVWTVVYGLLIMLMSVGIAYTEVVVVLLDEPGAAESLRRFALGLSGIMAVILLLINLTPLAGIWFREVAALPPDLVEPARRSLWFGLLIPSISVLEGWFNGTLLNGRKTRGITEAVFLGLLVVSAILVAGIIWGSIPGLYVGVCALATGSTIRVVWLWRRASPLLRAADWAEQNRVVTPAAMPGFCRVEM